MNAEDIFKEIRAVESAATIQAGDPTVRMLPVRAGAVSPETRKLAENVMEELSGVSVKWLGSVLPVFDELVVKAQSKTISDEDFAAAVERAAVTLPELFDRLNPEALQTAMEKAMGAAMANGAIKRQIDYDRHAAANGA